MTLPKLLTATNEAAAQFNSYFPALLAHEQGHKRIALDAANQVDRAIADLRPMTDCQALEQEANRTGLAVLESARRREVEYDAITKSGCTQGACLPSSR
jgi:predicted secreted Zn-dependent protease